MLSRVGLTRKRLLDWLLTCKTVNSDGFVEVNHSHVSGVSVITGTWVEKISCRLTGEGSVAIPTTLNSAGCDMKDGRNDIDCPDLEQQFEIITQKIGSQQPFLVPHMIEELKENQELHL